MLRRKAYNRLVEWKNNGKKPLLVYGQRQVGKTFIIKKFADENFSKVIYADLSRDNDFCSIFKEKRCDIDSIILSINTLRPIGDIDPKDSVIILDEIQDCEEALSALKLFAIDGRYKVIASGSMLGVTLDHKNRDDRLSPLSPMGYIEPYVMYSLDFEEFLWSQDIPVKSIELVRDCIKDTKRIPDAIYSKFQELFNHFMIIGGMPASVEAFNNDRSTFRYSSNELESITTQIHRDINRYNRGIDIVKTTKCFDSIPAQLSQTNKRFHYSRMDEDSKNTRKSADKYMNNLLWIRDAGYGNFVYSLDQIASPLEGQKKPDVFKVYLSDTGMLTHLYGNTAITAIFRSDISYNLGAITENVIAECLIKCGYKPAYYQKTNGDARMEIDFVIEMIGGLVAIEVKSGKKRDAPSIGKVKSYFTVDKRIMLEKSNISVSEDGILHMPLFSSAFLDSMDEVPMFLK